MANFFDQADTPAENAVPSQPIPVATRTSTPSDFASTYGDAAKRAGDKLGVDPHVLLGQWGLETGWGKSVVPGTNNLGNIKDMTGSGVAATDNMTGSKDKYRSFATPNDFADHYADLINRKYQGAVGAGSDASKFAGALAAGGYAQDPNYAAKVTAAAGTVSKAANPVLRAANAVTDAIMPSAHAATPAAGNFFDQADTPANAATPAKANFFDQADPPARAAPAPNPTDGNNFLQNTALGLKKGLTDIGIGIKQRLDDGAAYLENKLGGQSVNAALGLQNASDIQKQDQAYVDQKRADDVPLMQTTGGKIGNFIGTAIPAVAAAFVPGGQTLAGSAITGGLLGAAAPTATGESVAGNTIAGVAGGGAGFGIGRGIGALAGAVTNKAAIAATTNAARDTVAGVAKDAGYVIPPSQTNPGFINGALEGFAGKLSTAQKASVKNQAVTNQLAAQELGLNPTQPITKDALAQLRTTAGQAYDNLSNIGGIPTDSTFLSKIADLGKSNQLLAKSFPGMENIGIDKLTQSLNQPSFDSAAAVEALKHLRFAGNANKISLDPANKALGSVQTKVAGAIEDLMDRHLSNIGQTDLLSNFQNARQQIAKSYSVEKALNDATGNVNAGQLTSQLNKGKPLSGNLQTIAQVGGAFPKAVQNVTSSMPGVSPLDYLGAALMHGVSGGASLLTLGARPLARAAILSKPYQTGLGVPGYGGSTILNTLSSQSGRIALQAAGAVKGSQQEQRDPSDKTPGFAEGGLIGALGADTSAKPGLAKMQEGKRGAKREPAKIQEATPVQKGARWIRS